MTFGEDDDRGMKRATWIAVEATVGWLLLCAWYVSTNIGWGNIGFLLPHELAAVLLGPFAPLIFMWLALAYFGRGVQRYLDHFERLLNEANESDPENLLSSTFLSADIGELYLVPARSVGRLN